MLNKCRRMLSVFLVALLMLGALPGALALDFENGGQGDYPLKVNDQFVYAELGNDEIAIVQYIGKDKIVDIASAFPGQKVVNVQHFAFEVTRKERYIQLGSTKYKCKTKVQKIIFPDTVRYIGSYLIGALSPGYLKEINLPASLVDAHSAFSHCSISEVPALPEGVSPEVFDLFGNQAKTVAFPEGYTFIPDHFMSCSETLSLQFPATLRSIGEGAFHSCAKLKELVLPEGFTTLGASAFKDCSSLSSIVMPDTVTEIGENAFTNCSKLKDIQFSSGLTALSDWLFASCTSLVSVTLPERVRVIGSQTFDSCTKLKTIALPSTMTAIGVRAFASCKALTAVVVPQGVTAVGYEAFDGCVKLASVTLPSTLERIEDGTFRDCKALKAIQLPDGLKAVGSLAFFGCKKLASVIIPASVIEIAEDAFDGCAKKLTLTVAPDSYAEWWAMTNGYAVEYADV